MSTPTDEVTVDFDAIDAEVAKGKANVADTDPIVVDKGATQPEKAEKTAPTVEESVDGLKKQLEDERAAREEEKNRRIAAEARANEAAQGEADARGKVQTTQLDQIKGAIAQISQAKDILKAKYAEAAAIGDWAAASEVQSQMADNAADLNELKRAEKKLESAPKPTPRAPIDPVEAYAGSIQDKWPRSAQWLRAHPDFVTDQRKNRRMVRAHEDAIDAGHPVDSDAYLKYIEKRLDLATAESNGMNGGGATQNGHADPLDDPMADAAKPVNGGRSAAPAAPVSRSSSGNGGGSKPNRVTLTPAQIEMAHASFPDSKTPLEDYARQLQALRKEGRLQ